MPNKLGQTSPELLPAHRDLVMNRIQMFRHGASIGELAVGSLFIADGKSFNGSLPDFGHERRHHTRIQAPTQEHAQGHVAHQVTGNRLLQKLTICTDIIAPWLITLPFSLRDVPVGLDLNFAGWVNLKCVAGGELMDAGEKRFRTCHKSKCEVFWYGCSIEFGADSGVSQNSFNFGAKEECLRGQPVVERFDAQPIPGSEIHLAPRIPKREGKHPTQASNAVFSVLLVKVNNGFRVAVSAIMVTLFLQPRTEFLVVVDFAVENQPDRSVFVADRLVARLKVDDA